MLYGTYYVIAKITCHGDSDQFMILTLLCVEKLVPLGTIMLKI